MTAGPWQHPVAANIPGYPQLHERLELAEQDKATALELAEAKAASELQKTAAAKDAAIQEMKAKLGAHEVTQKLAVAEALSAVEKERDALVNELEQTKQEKQSSVELAEAKLVNELRKAEYGSLIQDRCDGLNQAHPRLAEGGPNVVRAIPIVALAAAALFSMVAGNFVGKFLYAGLPPVLLTTCPSERVLWKEVDDADAVGGAYSLRGRPGCLFVMQVAVSPP